VYGNSNECHTLSQRVNIHKYFMWWLIYFVSASGSRSRLTLRKALPGFFLCVFSSITCLKKPVFSKWDLLWWKVPATLYWELTTSQPVTISKGEKISALLYIGKGPEYRPFRDFRPVPSTYQPRAQISNHTGTFT
jgi:hypothetical protein